MPTPQKSPTPGSTSIESTMRDIFGDKGYETAIANLNAGRCINRMAGGNAIYYASWNAPAPQNYYTYLAPLPNNQQGSQVYCSCRGFNTPRSCEHAAALVLAYLSDPESFVPENDVLSRYYEQAMKARPSAGAAYSDEYDNDDDDEEELTGSDKSAADAPDATLKEYQTGLELFTVQKLRAIAERRGIPISGIRKDAIVAAVAAGLAGPGEQHPAERLAQFWPKLSPLARQVMHWAPFALHGDRLIQPDWLNKIADNHARSAKEVSAALEELQAAGLLLSANNSLYKMPAGLTEWLPPAADWLPAHSIAKLRQLPATNMQTALRRLSRLAILLQSSDGKYILNKDEALSPRSDSPTYYNMQNKTQGWPLVEEDLKKYEHTSNERSGRPDASIAKGLRLRPIAHILGDSNAGQLAEAVGATSEELNFQLHLLRAAGMYTIAPNRALSPQASPIRDFLLKSPQQQAEWLFNVYFFLPTWGEFDLLWSAAPNSKRGLRMRYVPTYYSSTSYDRLLSGILLIRRDLFALLSSLPVGHWASIADLSSELWNLLGHLLYSSFGQNLNIEYDERPLKISSPEDGIFIIRQIITAALSGPFTWLGFVQAAYGGQLLSSPPVLEAVCLTAEGAAAMGQYGAPPLAVPASSAPSLSFPSPSQITLDLDHAPADAIQLVQTIGKLEDVHANRATYHLSQSRFRQAIQSGWNAEAVIQALTALSPKPVPPEMSASLQRWQVNYGSVQLYQQIGLIEFADDYILNELLASTSLSTHLVYRFSSRLVAIRASEAEDFYAELQNKGYTPKYGR